MNASVAPALALELVAEAARAPSAHNTQPARWRFVDGGVVLCEDTRRRLPVGDPTGRDQEIGLGAALEGMALAASRRGLELDQPAVARLEPGTWPEGVRPVARAALLAGRWLDDLASWVPCRHTYRGRFLRPTKPERSALQRFMAHQDDVVTVADPAEVAVLAREADDVSFAFLARADFQSELHAWIRFTRGHPDWARDGLTADALGFSAVERLAGSWLFEPRRFAVLARLGLHRLVAAEAGRTATATAIAVLHGPAQETLLADGRRFYRFWLELTRAGYHARPMSALVDDAAALRRLRTRCCLTDSRRVMGVFAVGLAPAGWQGSSPRLPAEELLV